MKNKYLIFFVITLSSLFFTLKIFANSAEKYDGSAAAYTDISTNEIIKPSIEVIGDHTFYNWPNWNRSKNRKLQLHRERTTHPDAQWWPHAGLGIFTLGYC